MLTATATEWTACETALPLDGETVATKIDDTKGCRNHAVLYRQGLLWVDPDSKMYMYYTPTHWHPIDPRGEGL